MANEMFGLGLNVPAKRPERLVAIEGTGFMLTKDEIRKRISDSRRANRRKVFDSTWTKNQSYRSACCGYAYALTLEKVEFMAGLPRRKLSGDYIYSLINDGRDNGAGLEEGAIATETKGISEEQYVKYLEYRFSQMSQEARENAKEHMGFEWFRADTKLGLASGLASGFFGVIATHYTDRMKQLDSRGVSARSLGVGNHAENVEDVEIVGDDFIFWLHNSHSNSMGLNGHHAVTWEDHLIESNKYHSFTLFRACRGPTQGEYRTPQI